MMYVIFNQDGSTKTQNLGEFIQQGSSNYNSIFVSLDTTLSYSVSAYCTLPNGSTLTLSGVSTTKTIEETEYEGYLITLNAASLVYSGNLLMAISCVNSNQVLITYPITLTINATGVNDNTSLNITNGQLNGYQANLSAKQNTYSVNNFRSYPTLTALNSDLSNLAENQVFYVVATKKFYKKVDSSYSQVLDPVYYAGSNIRIIGNEISATGTIQAGTKLYKHTVSAGVSQLYVISTTNSAFTLSTLKNDTIYGRVISCFEPTLKVYGNLRYSGQSGDDLYFVYIDASNISSLSLDYETVDESVETLSDTVTEL